MHELAHMWFGDLVADALSGTGIWLNEAMRDLHGALLLPGRLPPRVGDLRRLLPIEVRRLGVDGLHSTVADRGTCRRPAPEEAAAMFDVLTCEKGAGVLWMLERLIPRLRSSFLRTGFAGTSPPTSSPTPVDDRSIFGTCDRGRGVESLSA